MQIQHMLFTGCDVNWVATCLQARQLLDLTQVKAPESHYDSLKPDFIYVDLVYMFQATVLLLV